MTFYNNSTNSCPHQHHPPLHLHQHLLVFVFVCLLLKPCFCGPGWSPACGDLGASATKGLRIISVFSSNSPVVRVPWNIVCLQVHCLGKGINLSYMQFSKGSQELIEAKAIRIS